MQDFISLFLLLTDAVLLPAAGLSPPTLEHDMSQHAYFIILIHDVADACPSFSLTHP